MSDEAAGLTAGRSWAPPLRDGPVRILVADDHPICRLGLMFVLSSAGDIEVVGEASNGAEAVEAVEQLRPDLVLMDLTMPVLDGFAALEQISTRFPDIPVIVLTASCQPEQVFRALDAGASGYLVKTAEPNEIIASVHAASLGSMPISSAVTRQLFEQSRSQQPQLSSRELEVLALVAAGELNKQIARRLGISEKTVKAHLTRIFQRIGVHDRAGAATWAMEHPRSIQRS